MTAKPTSIDLYTYNVFFGDCFLLIFHYPDKSQRSVLIDFGSTGKGRPAADTSENDPSDDVSTGARLVDIAKHINATCGQKLDVVVATHRHKDHIYGFGLKDAAKLIMDCEPSVVIQPWTEDPKDNRDFSRKKVGVDKNAFAAAPKPSFTAMLDDMHDVSEAIYAEAAHLGDADRYNRTVNPIVRENILFAADDNKKIPNGSAIKNLQRMSPDPHYVHYGYAKVNWNKLLPGVKVRILGPPLLEDYPKIAGATTTSDEFWSLLAVNRYFWGILAATNSPTVDGEGFNPPLFEASKTIKKDRPANMRWFIRRLRDLRASQLLELVGFVDNALNNTSVILHFEVGDQKLLFPGDAQIENWQFLLLQAASDPKLKALLADTTLYKVGHHGSRNATPKSIWHGFDRVVSKKTPKDRLLKTVVSTMSGKHGKSENTVVPLKKLIDTLRTESDLTDTEEFTGTFFKKITIAIA